jgi:hypothetical protein
MDAHTSQFETVGGPRRIVLLGASNLSMSFPNIVELARATWRRPLEFFTAMGFGRSYGQQSKFFGKKFSGILQSGLWDALSCAPRVQTVAIVADVGNDLAYEAPVEWVLDWVRETLDRLDACDARVVLNNIPIESLRTVGGARYGVVKSILFPNCRVQRREMLRRAEALSEGLQSLAETRKTPVFSGEIAWYGWDPIHPRRAHAGVIWQRMMAALDAHAAATLWRPPPREDAFRLRRLQTRAWWRIGTSSRSAALTTTLMEGSSVALY